MESADQGSYGACALREIEEEVTLPTEWVCMLKKTILRCPNGHCYLEFDHNDKIRRQVVMWVVRIPVVTENAVQREKWTASPYDEWVTLKSDGVKEVRSKSLSWRPLISVINNLKQFETFQVFGKALEKWLLSEYPIHRLLQLVCMHDLLQEVGSAMLWKFESEEAQIIWAGLGCYDNSIQPVMLGRRWVLRLSLNKRWAAVSKGFKESNHFQQIQYEVKKLYHMHQRGGLDKLCNARLTALQVYRSFKDYPTLQSRCSGKLDAFTTLTMPYSKDDPNRVSPAWLVGSGFPLPWELRKSQWKFLFQIGRPTIQLCQADYELSERATQNHTRQGVWTSKGEKYYWTGLFRSLDAAPVVPGPILGLRRHAGQNGGRSGIEYSNLGMCWYYVGQTLPSVCHVWGLAKEYDARNRLTPAYLIARVVNMMIDAVS